MDIADQLRQFRDGHWIVGNISGDDIGSNRHEIGFALLLIGYGHWLSFFVVSYVSMLFVQFVQQIKRIMIVRSIIRKRAKIQARTRVNFI
ncbi:hypothetical protein [Mesorhizobium sp. WSM3626]|uniref:hypothetical protein n=1 Tax=Mesorhizobium sp. WSM3626 TaxID=1040987 RepID=UPI001FD9E4A3|nr:hypothetical protein [Mesorhizobium sp. WSM3626]